MNKALKITLISIAILFGFIMIIGVLGAALGAGQDAKTAAQPTTFKTVDTGPSPEPVITPTNKPTPTKPPVEKKVTPTPKPKPTKTVAAPTASQEQAIGAAQDYLDYTAFSRKGLIAQLSSKAGDGFSKADATYAVDSLKVNWNEQAALAAQQYLDTMHFSRSGLIDQLESSAGDGFTHKQAVYGANAVGLK